MLRIEDLADRFTRDLPGLLAHIEEVVNIDSGSRDVEGVNRVQSIFAAQLRDLGFAVMRVPGSGRGDQLTARRAFGSGPNVLILGHADTVWPAGTAAEWPFGRSGDALTGPGIADMKSNVILAIHALKLLIEGVGGADMSGVGSVTFLIVPDEEIGSPQSKDWITAEGARCDFCLTLEPARPGGGTVVSRGAVGAAYINATGVTAHAGSNRLGGASAISALAPLVGGIEALGSIEAGNYATVGVLRGGASKQVVAGECEAHLDLRASSRQEADRLWEEITRIVETAPRDPRVTLTLTGGFIRPCFPQLPGMTALYGRAEAFARALRHPIAPNVSRGGSDGSFVAAQGKPTLDGLGVIGHDICSRREWAELSSLAPRGAMLAGLIASGGDVL
ncbi:M20 family metallopeptidase [Haematobacter genomosp. 1]|nr:M20 family metallopeptidase [Haematobacter genomosp. 1]